ncbi:glycosyltransferase family 4 protein [Streptomyces tricolor]|nr:glycosyltransferase family 4 protein [Streptomyces tricolor]
MRKRERTDRDPAGAVRQGLRVCLLLRYFTVGGLERVVTSLANELVERGVDVRVVALAVAKRNALMTELDPRVEAITLSGPPLRPLAAVARLTRGRVVHLHFGDGRIHPLVRLALRGPAHRRLVLQRLHPQAQPAPQSHRPVCQPPHGSDPRRVAGGAGLLPLQIRTGAGAGGGCSQRHPGGLPEACRQGEHGGLVVISLAGLYHTRTRRPCWRAWRRRGGAAWTFSCG